MPLRDPFHPPLSQARHWKSFHAAWTAQLVRHLNRRVLPPDYFAEPRIHVGCIEDDEVTSAPPSAVLAMPIRFPDEIEVRVFETSAGLTLAAAIEFVSPGNKDRHEERRAFAAKCMSYLHAGVGLVIVDVLTNRQANLHDELIDLMERPETFRFPAETSLYATAYRPVRQKGNARIEMWLNSLAVGQLLPTVALALRDGPTVPVDLEATYAEVFLDLRLA